MYMTKQVQTPTDSTAEADAAEIEVTGDMLEAGALALAGYMGRLLSKDCSVQAEMIKGIYRAMAEKAPDLEGASTS